MENEEVTVRLLQGERSEVADLPWVPSEWRVSSRTNANSPAPQLMPRQASSHCSRDFVSGFVPPPEDYGAGAAGCSSKSSMTTLDAAWTRCGRCGGM